MDLPLKVLSVRLHSKSHQKRSKCQNSLTGWHLSFLGGHQLKKHPIYHRCELVAVTLWWVVTCRTEVNTSSLPFIPVFNAAIIRIPPRQPYTLQTHYSSENNSPQDLQIYWLVMSADLKSLQKALTESWGESSRGKDASSLWRCFASWAE